MSPALLLLFLFLFPIHLPPPRPAASRNAGRAAGRDSKGEIRRDELSQKEEEEEEMEEEEEGEALNSVFHGGAQLCTAGGR